MYTLTYTITEVPFVPQTFTTRFLPNLIVAKAEARYLARRYHTSVLITSESE